MQSFHSTAEELPVMEPVERDPLFRQDSPASHLLENPSDFPDSPVQTARDPVEGPLCSNLDSQFVDPNVDFVLYAGTVIAAKFLLTGKPPDLKPASEVRVSLKILALKCLAALSKLTRQISEVRIKKQGVMDVAQLLTDDDDALAMVTYEFIANMESVELRIGNKGVGQKGANKFLVLTNQVFQNATPRVMKEGLQILASNLDLIYCDQVLAQTVFNATIESFECDYFLLKTARAEFLSSVDWKRVSAGLKQSHQSLCITTLVRQLFDDDFRVSNATCDLLPRAVRNAECGTISNIYHCHWPEAMAAPSFPIRSSLFGLHRFYNFNGDTPDLALEQNLAYFLHTLNSEMTAEPLARMPPYIHALQTLAQAHPPSLYSSAWFGQSSKCSKSMLLMLLEFADQQASSQTELTHLLRLVAQLFAGCMEYQFANCSQQRDKESMLYMDGHYVLDKIITLYLRILNLFYTIVRETKAKAPSSAVTSPLFSRAGWGTTGTAGENRSYSISHLVGTGIHPTRASSYTQSASLAYLEAAIRGAHLNVTNSLKREVEERASAVLDAALDGFCAVLEMVSREVLNSFIDELFLYIRTLLNSSVSDCTALIQQLIRVLFDKNAFHVDPNMLVSLRVKQAVQPSDQLEMLVGRAINNFSVYIAFLDRTEHMSLHQMKHFGWSQKNAIIKQSKRSANHALEIGSRLEQFEHFVTYLLNAFLGSLQMEEREKILSLVIVLLQNDVCYDKLDPKSCIWQAVLQFIRQPKVQPGPHLANLFVFACQVVRVIDVSFGELVALLQKCVENVDEGTAESVLEAVYVVVLEAVGHYGQVPDELAELLSSTNSKLMTLDPSKTIQLTTIVLHFFRSIQSDLVWKNLSADFANDLDLLLDNGQFEKQAKTERCSEFVHSVTVALKTCHPSTFRPINQLYGWFLKGLKIGLGASLPFLITLVCRIDVDVVVLQLGDIQERPMETMATSMAQILMDTIPKLLSSKCPSDLAELEETIAFSEVLILHLLRADFSGLTSDSFRSAFRNKLKQNVMTSEWIQLMTKLSSLRPKVYAFFITLVLQLDLLEKSMEKLFYSSSLPYAAKQLSTLLVIQRLTDLREPVTDQLVQFFQNASDEFMTRVLKLSSEKNLSVLIDRLGPVSVTMIALKVKSFLQVNNINALYRPLLKLLESEKCQDKSWKVVLDSEPFSSLASVRFGCIRRWIDGRKSDVNDLSKCFNKLSECDLGQSCVRVLNNLVSHSESERLQDELDCLAQLASALKPQCLVAVVEATPSLFRTQLLEQLFVAFDQRIRDNVCTNYMMDKYANVASLVDSYKALALLMDTSTSLSGRDYRTILVGFSQIPVEFVEFEQVKVGSLDKVLNDGFVVDVIDAEMTDTPLEPAFHAALSTLMSRSDLSIYNDDDLHCIEHMTQFLSLLLDHVEACLPKTERFKLPVNAWNVGIKASCTRGEMLKEDVLESFYQVQRAAHVLNTRKSFPDQKCFKQVEASLVCRCIHTCSTPIPAILRMDVFSRMFIAPKSALVRDWAPQIEINAKHVHVPLVSIHLLSEVAVLSDFVCRVNLIGWSKRSQFEECFMSLFGVLCSTPVGLELDNENIGQIIDQINASSLAVEALTSMLVSTLLYPTPGDVVNSSFVVKPRQTRDSYLFLNSINGRKASTARTQIESVFSPSQVFTHNPERAPSGQLYSIGQTSVFYLWTMVGELEPSHESSTTTTQNTAMRSSISQHLLKASTDIDTSSSLKSLLDNYFHWFEQGFEALPLPLLTATVKSIALLSDMFDDQATYRRVYGYFKDMFNNKYLEGHPAHGYVIYILLKFVSVLDIDKLDEANSKSDVRKVVDNILHHGLSCGQVPVVMSTLHGFLYIIQSVIVDDLEAQIKRVGEFVIEELENSQQKADVITSTSTLPIDYQKLLLSVAFRLTEHHGNGDSLFHQRFIKVRHSNRRRFLLQLIKSSFIDSRTPTWQKSLIANGIQSLVCHSAAYGDMFREAALELFDTYQLRPMHLPYALSVYVTCIYRLAQHESRIEDEKVDLLKCEFQKILNMFSFFSLRCELRCYLPVLADTFSVFLTKRQVLDLELNLILPGAKDEQLQRLSDYDRVLCTLFHFTLHAMAQERRKEAFELAKNYVLPTLTRVPARKLAQYLTALALASVSGHDDVLALANLLLRRVPDGVVSIQDVFAKVRKSFQNEAAKLHVKFNSDDQVLLDNLEQS